MNSGRNDTNGGVCVYCVQRPAETRDHVIARQFFPEPRPSNLIKVPCCERCNGEKRELEEYAWTVFVSHASALRPESTAGHLAREKLFSRLEKRQRLRQHLFKHTVKVDVPGWLARSGVHYAMTVPNEKVVPLIKLITKGLIFHLSERLFPEGTGIKASFDVDDSFLHRFGKPFKEHRSTRGSLGDQVFDYAYLTIKRDFLKSIWIYGFYDLVYGWASVGPDYWAAEARRNARIEQRRKERKAKVADNRRIHPAFKGKR